MQTTGPDKQKMPKLPKLGFTQWTGYKDGCQYSYLGTDGRIGQNSAETRTDSVMVLNVSGKDKNLSL